MKDPCAGCENRSKMTELHCNQTCANFIGHQTYMRHVRERIKKAKHQEDEFTMYRYDKDYQPKTRRREE